MLIPAVVQVLHTFDHNHDYGHDHEHHSFGQIAHHDCNHNHNNKAVYILNKKDHVQFEDDCTVCELIFDTSGLFEVTFDRIVHKLENPEQLYSYHFQKNHQSLSYSLRGPPLF